MNTAFVTGNFIGGAVGSALAGLLWQTGGWTAVMLGGVAALTLALLVWATNRRTLTTAAHSLTRSPQTPTRFHRRHRGGLGALAAFAVA